ncbi:MAG: carboxypeptidase regulatory-like domain-containing protein, partial [Candidatus Zixiibacteriota bacterium]
MRTGSAILRVMLVGVVAIGLCSACRHVHSEQSLTGVIEGVVTDSASGELIWNASVLVKGTKIGATTANSGHFWIKGVPAGSHDLLAMEVAHKRAELHGVIVRANDVTQVSIQMAAYEADMLLDPVVQAVEVNGKTYGEIEGTVWDTSIGSPQPVACAIVSLVGTKIQVESGAMGQFHMKHVEPGWQALFLKAYDYDSTTDSVFVSAGRVSKVDAILRPTFHDWFIENEDRLGIEVSEIHGCIEGKVTD